MKDDETSDVQLNVVITIWERSIQRLAAAMAASIRNGMPEDDEARPRPAQDAAADRLLVDSREAARLLSVSERTLWGMQKEGRSPSPVRLGRSVRWRRQELEAWIDAGCPAAAEWRWGDAPSC